MSLQIGSQVKVTKYPQPFVIGKIGRVTALKTPYITAELTGDIMNERLFKADELVEVVPTPAPAPVPTNPKFNPLPGDFVEVPLKLNSVWGGIGKVRTVYPFSDSVELTMVTGSMIGKEGSFPLDKVLPASDPNKVPGIQTDAGARGAALAGKGINAAISTHAQVFYIAKNLAKQLGKQNPVVNADMIQAELEKLGYSSADLGNAAGGVFRGKDWQVVGYRNSNRTTNHARTIKNWKYLGA